MHVRDCAPVGSHVLAKPPHAPNAVHVVGEHDMPLVLRAHPAVSVSVLVLGTHVPDVHVKVVQVLVRDPFVAHALA